MDNAIALQVQTPDSFKTIGSVLNTAGQAQSLQAGKQQLESQNIALQKQRQENQERLATQQFMSNPENFQTNGRIDLDKINNAIPKIAPLTGAATVQHLSTLANAQTGAENAKLAFNNNERAVVGQLYGVMGRAGVDDPKIVGAELDNLSKQYPDNKAMQDYIANAKVGLGAAQAGKGAINKSLITTSQSLMSPDSQQASLSPTASLTPMGGTTNETITTPGVGGQPPSVRMTGASAPLTLPPTATKFNPQTNAPEYVGQQAGGGHIQAGPALGQPEIAAGVSSGVSNDWNAIQASAKNAAQNIGVLQEIKKYAPGAVTGVTSDRRAFLAGLAGLVGISVEQLQKTDTDLLAKNSSMLALAGGDTNLAKTLAETANPNTHMTPQAIQKAANQVIGQQQLHLARQQFLQPYINNPNQYNEMATKFNSIADPRVLQLPSLTPQEQIEMKKAMSPAERIAFGNKIRAMQQFGILK